MFQPSEYSYGQWPPPDAQTLMVARPDVVLEEEQPTLLPSIWAAYSLATLVAWPFAVAVSYKRNKSLGWAFLAGFVPIPYLVYTQVIDKDSK